MSETAQKLLEIETPDWQKVFLKQWEVIKKDAPDTTLEDSIRISIRLRTLIKAIYEKIK